MALNIPGLVSKAFGTALKLVPDALPTVTLRSGPTTTVNPVTDTSTTTWKINKSGLRPVAFEAKNERDSQPVETTIKSFAFQASDLPSGPLDQKAEILEGTTLWNVYRVEKDPTASLIIFHARK